MDIKLKNNNDTRRMIALAVVSLLAIVTVCLLPGIGQRAQETLEHIEQTQESTAELNTDLVRQLYRGSYVLYLETAQRKENCTASDVYMEASYTGSADEQAGMRAELEDWTNGTLEALGQDFERYRSQIDYCILLGDGQYEKNTSQPLEAAFQSSLRAEKEEQLQQYYNNYFVMQYDKNGILTVQTLYNENAAADALIKAFGQTERENSIWGGMEEEYREQGITCEMKKPSGFAVAFAIPKTADYQLDPGRDGMYGTNADYWTMINTGADAGAQVLYSSMLLLIALLVFLMTSRRVWKTDICMNRPGNWYLMEAAIVGIISVLSMNNTFIEMIWNYGFSEGYSALFARLTQRGAMSVWGGLITVVVVMLLIYAAWYLSIRFIRPVFALGLREYIRQYSVIYQIFPWLKGQWKRFTHEVGHVDFGQKSTRTILKLVGLNFIILTVISCLWFFGIGALIVYTIGLFFLIKKYYDKVGRDYQVLLRGVNQIAKGNLDVEITEDLGVFEPFKGELSSIRLGFKKAVDEEVRSQRMKADLITNVSHDLKTPLTAITTYIELLKKEDITEAERRSYIDTLEKKSLRLKVLIEDLFEVSKATSNNITLSLMEVDVANLLKQVSVEYADKYADAGLELRWRLPEEKVVLMLDNQKTYRIFENLFGNILKYAMPHSRVYIDVDKIAEAVVGGQGLSADAQEMVEITIKNMSACELNFQPEEITERFVRGDVSRNTEGSGLGLAIAKSFAEAQGGKLSIEVDGDLFKVVIRWKCDKLQVDNA